MDVTAGITTTVSAPSNGTIRIGQYETDSATVTGNVTGGNPTGSVSFYECGPTQSPQPCTSQANQVGSAVGVTAGPGDTATAMSPAFTASADGYWCFAAVYSGDPNYQGSSDTSTDECFDVIGPLTITTTSLADGTKGQPYSASVSAEGGTPPYTWSHAGTKLPRGLSLNRSSGVISGTPKKAGAFTFTIRVKDYSHPKQKTAMSFTITIAS